MTNISDRPRWNDERLDRLADAVDGLREAVNGLREQAESNTRNVDILVGIVTVHQERFTTLLEEIRDRKTEIRGLQTENRRILDHLFGQEDGE